MSSMCGIVDFEKKSVNFSVLREMGRAMVLRGPDQSGAYLTGGIGLYHNRALCGEDESARQPYTVVRGDHAYTVMVDGILKDSRYADGQFALFDFSSAAEAVLEAYLSFGLDFSSYVQGSFAFAICDEYRGEMILGRSADGRRPLYYTYADGRLIFASEVKGMLHNGNGRLPVNEGILRRHLAAPMGSFDACALYPTLFSIRAGTCTVFSRIDAQTVDLPFDGGEETEIGPLLVPSAADAVPLDECLAEALQAFDYPQFDADMQSYLGLLRQAREKNMRAVRILDGARRESLSYAREREDRLGSVCGVTVQGVTPPDLKRSSKPLRALEHALSERLSLCDARILTRLYGEGVIETVKREKEISRRIRMMGILCQSEPWMERYALSVTRSAV